MNTASLQPLLYTSYTCTDIDYDYILIMHSACQPRSGREEGSIKGLRDCGTPCWDERGGKSQGEGSVEKANQSAVRWERDQSWLQLGALLLPISR